MEHRLRKCRTRGQKDSAALSRGPRRELLGPERERMILSGLVTGKPRIPQNESALERSVEQEQLHNHEGLFCFEDNV